MLINEFEAAEIPYQRKRSTIPKNCNTCGHELDKNAAVCPACHACQACKLVQGVFDQSHCKMCGNKVADFQEPEVPIISVKMTPEDVA